MVGRSGTSNSSSRRSATSAKLRSRASLSSSARKSGTRIAILSPAHGPSRAGNAVTARRYARFFRALGYRVRIYPSAIETVDAEIVVALHAKKSAAAALRFRKRVPHGRLIVVLTGTDIYRDLPRSRLAQRAVAAADALVALQPLALARLAPSLRAKAATIVQSVSLPPLPIPSKRIPKRYEFAVLGHLRDEKDPLRAAYALKQLPSEIPAFVTLAGGILDDRYRAKMNDEAARNARFRYRGEIGARAALALLSRSDALVLSSRMEGGANVLGEAIALRVPVLASRIDGNIGLLGKDYPGYFTVGSTASLRALLTRFIEDRAFRRSLRAHIAALAPLVRPARERAAWARLLRRCHSKR
ncbi:MAG: selenoneine biosynthesis selenosugar synthase SenB [Candidatus Baltobacteraceae bacterium]